MTPELWQRVCRAYDRAAELAADQRAEYLDELRKSDADAAVALQELLSRGGGPRAIAGPPTNFLDGLLDDTEAASSGGRAERESWPERIGQYRVTRELARGGMGVVLLAVDEKFNRPIAVKILSREHATNSEFVLRFLEEAQLMGRLQHPGIPPVHDRGELPDGRPYLAMKLIKGQTLSEMLRARAKVGGGEVGHDLSRWLSIFEQVCHTLAYAHARGILHRDLKPGNIMVGAHGEVQVMDWGLAKVLTRRGNESGGDGIAKPIQREAVSFVASPSLVGPATTTGSVMGTIAYMAPEQARGEVEFLDERCDVFGLGAILCEILTGSPAFTAKRDGDLIDLARAGDVSQALARLDACGADAKLLALAKTCVAPQRIHRPGDASAVAKALVEYQAEFQQRLRTAEIQQAAAQVKAAEERKRRVAGRRWAAVVALFVTLAAVAGAWFYVEREQAKLAARDELLKAKVEGTLRDEDLQADSLQKRLADYLLAQELISNPGDWGRQLEQRRELLDRAENLLASSSGSTAADLARLLATQKDRLTTDIEDLRLARELDAIHLESFVPLVAEKDKRAAAGPRYARFFTERLGMNIGQAEVATIATGVQNSRLRHILVSALDHWAEVADSSDDDAQKLLRSLLQITVSVDPDPWRDQFRRPQAWQNFGELERLATELKPALQSPQLLILFANLLEENGGNGFAVLQAALLEHPRNFWLNLTTANLAKYASEKAGYFQAALAERQDNSMAWNNLGAALFRQHKLVEAMSAYNNAARLDPKDWNPHRLIARIHLLEGRFTKASMATDKALKLLVPDHPFYAEVKRQADEIKRCLDLQEVEKLQPVEGPAAQKSLEGRLTADDPLDLYLGNNNSPRKSHAVRFKGGQSYQIDLASSDFDPMLRVESGEWAPLAENDDILPGKLLNSRLVFTPAQDGTFRLVVNSFSSKAKPAGTGSGAYTLAWKEVVADGSPKQIEGELKKSSPRVDAKYAVEHQVTLNADTPYVFLLSGKRFDPYLRLLDTTGKLLAFNDDVAPGNYRRSRIDFTPPQAGAYLLMVTSYQPDETGSYDLSIQGFPAAK